MQALDIKHHLVIAMKKMCQITILNFFPLQGSLAYANFTSVISQNIPEIFGLCEFLAVSLTTAILGNSDRNSEGIIMIQKFAYGEWGSQDI